MILTNYKIFPNVGRVLGLDWGARRCGVAISDEKRDFVFTRPQLYIHDNMELITKITEILKTEGNIVGIVIGLPLHADGSDSDTTKLVRTFADLLSKNTDLPIIFIDETLTSATAYDELTDMDIKSTKKVLDSVSARVILENAISVLKRQ